MFVSCMHYDNRTDQNTGKVEVILDYNSLKDEVDAVS